MVCARLDRQRWRSEGMRRPKWAMVVRQGDAPAKWSNTKSVGWRRMCRQMERPNRRGMRRPSEIRPNWWRLGGECAGQMEQHRTGGSAANAPAKQQHQIGGSAANVPANERECGTAMRCASRTATPNRWIGGECTSKRKRMRRFDGIRQPNSNTKSVDPRRMRRQTKENAAWQ